MSTTEQKALELADRLQQDFNSEYINWDNVIEAAAELRRLSAENEALRLQIFDHQLVLRGWEVRTEWLRTSPDGHPNSPMYGHLKLPHLN